MINDYYPPGAEVPEMVEQDGRDYIPGPKENVVSEKPEPIVEPSPIIPTPIEEPVVVETVEEDEDDELAKIREEALKETDPEYAPEPPKKVKKGKKK